MVANMADNIEDKILKDILTTGFPLEMEVSNNFARDRWTVDHNSYYIDKDELKGREIDLIASYFLSNPKSNNVCVFPNPHCLKGRSPGRVAVR